jgi:hypothetical protein
MARPQVLRPVIALDPELTANIEMFAAILSTGLALILAAVSGFSYVRLRNRRALFITLAFVTFAVQAGMLTSLSYITRGAEGWLLPVVLANLLTLVWLYLALRLR